VSDDSLDPRHTDRLTRAARAARALSETLWEALHEELNNPRRQRVAELSAQLGEVTAIVASLAHADDRVRDVPGGPDAPVQPAPRAPRMTDEELRMTGEPSTREPPAFSAPPAPREPAAKQEALSPAVLVDELAPDGPAEIEIRDVRGEQDGFAGRSGSVGRRPSDYGYTQS
jgi:hypothetical protein